MLRPFDIGHSRMPDLFRTLLFVPGSRPERFDNAAQSGADVIALDLEDAVPPPDKDAARRHVIGYLAKPANAGARRFVRINSPKTAHGIRDLAALLDAPAPADGVVVPMVGTAEEVRWVDGLLGPRFPDVKLVAVVETSQGLANAAAIAVASPRLEALGFGAADFTAETGGEQTWDGLLMARSQIAFAAAGAGAGIVAIDRVWLDLDDEAGLMAETRRTAELGFRSKAAIHPKQVAPIHQALRPSEEDIARAQRIVAAFEAAKGAVVTVDGRMIDLPLVTRARRTLALAGR
jgi:citrate lyase beta subunit